MASYAEGLYQNVPIIGQGYSKSKEKNTPYFFLTIKPGDYERELRFYLPDGKEDAIDRLFSALERIGFDGSSFAELDPDNPKFWDFSQTTIDCECKHEANGGKTYERWELPFAGIAREVAPLDSKDVRKLDALFGKKLKDRFAGKRRASTVAQKAPTKAEIDSELAANPPSASDVPF